MLIKITNNHNTKKKSLFSIKKQLFMCTRNIKHFNSVSI